MAQPIIILGTGGNCIDILDTLHELNSVDSRQKYQCLGFLDDDTASWGKRIHDVPVLGPLSSAHEHPNALFVNGIGSPLNFTLKAAIIAKTKLPVERFATIIHPTASVSSLSQVGHGVVILQQVTVASNVRLGNHVIILPNSVISHDDEVGDYTCIAGGVCISGNVTVGHSCYLGTNSCIVGNIKIGKNCLIGMGSVVLGAVADHSVMVGNPARLLRHTNATKVP